MKKNEGQRLAKKFKCPYFEASAKTDEGVKEAFMKLAEDTVRAYYKV